MATTVNRHTGDRPEHLFVDFHGCKGMEMAIAIEMNAITKRISIGVFLGSKVLLSRGDNRSVDIV